MTAIAAPPMTSAELLRLPRGQWRYELERGELRQMSPAGHQHGRLAARFLGRLLPFVEAHALGTVYAAETGFLLAHDPDTVLAPDVAFVSAARLRQVNPPATGFFPGAPDLVVEVISPNDAYSDVDGKVLTWLTAGCRLVVLVDPRRESVVRYSSLSDIAILTRDQTLTAEDLLPGWSLRIGDLFD